MIRYLIIILSIMNHQIKFITELLEQHFLSSRIQVTTPNILISIDRQTGIQLSVLEKEVLISVKGIYWGFSNNRKVTIKSAITDIEAILMAGDIKYSILERNSASL